MPSQARVLQLHRAINQPIPDEDGAGPGRFGGDTHLYHLSGPVGERALNRRDAASLQVDSSNAPALALYAGLGFAKTLFHYV